ncbi:polymorphic toxin-type HINT domain-containing protein [Streptomyces decoyicus]|uniref:polymorphic toxin-type HINT domain-containing protein n=1 Tax=Streptomyces decoyicus TaxID=249567 RepID=UPI00364E01D9
MGDASTRTVEKVRPGEKVLATDPETGKTAPRKVTRLIVTEDDKHFNELTLTTPSGPRKLTATYEHPFWNPSQHRWLPANELTPGTTLLSNDGSTVRVQSNRPFDKHARTYNLTVDDLHTYYVMAGSTPVLVHNSSCDHIALGLQKVDGNPDALDEFGMDQGAATYKEWPGNGAWHKKLESFLAPESRTHISFNLDGISNPVASARAGKSVDPSNFERLTDWELYQVSQSPHAWDRITWYRGGSRVDNPFG